MNYILKSAAQVCSVVFLSVTVHPSKFSLSSPFPFDQLFRVSPSFLALPTVAEHEGWLGPPSPLRVSVPLTSVFCQPSWVSSPRTGRGASLGRPTFQFVCSVGLGWRAAKDGGGPLAVTWLPWSISPTALAKGPLAPIKLLPALDAPPHSSIPGRLEVAGGGRRAQKVPGRSRDRLHGPSTHIRGDSCSVSPIRLQSPRRNRLAPPSSSRACMSSRPATSSCTWRKVGRRAGGRACVPACLRACVPWGRGCAPGGGSTCHVAGAAALPALLEGSEATAWVVFVQGFTHPAPLTPVSSVLPLGDYVSICWRGRFWCQAEALGVRTGTSGLRALS